MAAPINAPLTPAEVAALLRIGRTTVYQLFESGELRHYRVGRAIRVRPEWVAEYVAGITAGGVAPVAAEPHPDG